MKKKKIFAICDLEEAYVVRLADYLNSRGSLPYQVLAFTNLDSLRSYAQENEIEILLISADAMTDEVRELRVKRVIILSDGEEPELERGLPTQGSSRAGAGEIPSVSKYQDADSLARQVMRHTNEEGMQALPEDCRLLAVWSPVGRCGKTLFALALAQVAGETGRSLYMNLEDYSGFEPLLRTTFRMDMADLFFTARDAKPNRAAMLEDTVQHFGALDILPPAFFPEDIRDITPGEWRAFAAQAAQDGGYRTVVLDIGAQQKDVADLLEGCTACYVPILPDPMSRAKISQFEKNMEALGKKPLLASLVRIYLPETEVKSFGSALLEELAYGKMGQFARQLLEEGKREAA